MKKLVLVSFILFGCRGEGTSVTVKDNVDAFNVVKLFTLDGCTVYRFSDAGSYRYFTNCQGVTAWNRPAAGKNSSVDEEIPTNCTE